MNGQMKKYKESLKKTPLVVLPAELRQVQIDYHGLIMYAKTKGVSVPELTDEEKNRFILNSNMERINKLRSEMQYV